MNQGGGRRAASGQVRVTGSSYEIWGQDGWASVDVVGESFHSAAIRAAFGPGTLPAGGMDLRGQQVHLVHNHLNEHDRNAIEVHGSTGMFGYLSRADAARYAPAIDQLQQRELVPATTARIWGGDQKDWDTGKMIFVGSVQVDLPEPHMMFPHNGPPAEPYELLPRGSMIRVAAGDGVAVATGPYLCVEGECWVHATMHEVIEQGPRSSKPLAEIRIDGRVVGRLTPKMSGDMLPAVRFLSERHLVTAVRAVVKGNQLKSEVVLFAARAGDLPQDWMDAVPIGLHPAGPGLVAAAVPVIQAEAHADVHSTAPALLEQTSIPPTALNGAPSAASPLMGWYQDPSGVARLRWWNGTRWTQDTAP